MAFVVGALVSSMALGSVLGFSGVALNAGSEARGIVTLFVLAYVSHNVFGAPAPPTTGWQVPRSWFNYGRFTYALVFGAALGVGVVTQVRTWGIYILVVGCLAFEDVKTATLVMGVFGAARAMPMLLAAGRYLVENYERTGLRAVAAIRSHMSGYKYVRAAQALTAIFTGVLAALLFFDGRR